MDKLEKSQLRFRIYSQSRRALGNILILLVVVLVILPFWESFQDVLTRFIMSVGWYRSLQNVIVPYELRIIGLLLTFLKFPVKVGNAYIEWTKTTGGNEVIYLAWNCVGWQTILLFTITLFSGLSGRHTFFSKLETLAIGILGTYLINIFRLVIVVVVYFFIGRPGGIIFHDYFSNLITLAWLFLFWWFSCSFVLVPREKKAN